MSKAAKGGAAADVPVSNTPMPTLASDAFLVDGDGDDFTDALYRQPVRQPRGEAAARKAAFRRLAAQSAALAAGGGADDVDDHGANTNFAASGFDGAGGGTGFKSMNPHQRTALEQSILDRIPGRIQSNLVRDQVVGGRKYQGPGFLPDPAIVRFQDFVVGKPMSLTVTLTNVSNGFNVFKVGRLPSTLVDSIEVSHAPTGLLSAGLRSKITITFTPKENVDIDSEIPLIAQTGPIAIPLQCRRPRAMVEVSAKLIDFGSVVVADKAVRKLTFRNTGATPTKVTLRGEQLLEALKTTQMPPPASNATAAAGATARSESVATNADGGARPVPILTVTPSDKALTGLFIPAFGSASVTLSFSPFQPTDIDVSGFLTFDSDDVPDQPFFIRGHGVDVPVFVDHNETLDLGCCCDGTLYRDKFSIRNTTTASAHVKPEVPPLLRGLVEFVPPFGFAQPASSGAEQLEFQLRFVPNAAKLAANRARVEALAAAARERRLASGSDEDAADAAQSTAAYIDELTAVNDHGTSDGATSVAGERRSPSAPDDSPDVRSSDVSPRPPTGAESSVAGASARAATGMGGTAAGPSSAMPGGAATTATGPSRAVRETICTDDQLQIPVRVRVLSQAMPLYVTLCARLSARRLGIEPSAIHFAGLSPAEAVKRTITLHNDTRLFRNVGLVKVPANIRVEPRSANVKLAPGEKYSFEMSVRPPEAAAAGLAAADVFRQQVQVLTEHGESFPITVSGTVRSPPLRFSAGEVLMPACAVHDAVSTTLTLTNSSRTAQCFSFGKLMKRYGLRVMPHTGELQPGDSVAVVITFAAHPAVAFPVVVPPEPADDDANKPEGTSPSAESPIPPPGGKAGKAPAPKKKSKADEEAERKAKEEAEAAAAAARAEREAARRRALDELDKVCPWEESFTEETAARAAAREEAIMAALRQDAEAHQQQQHEAASSHVEPEPKTVEGLDSTMPLPGQSQNPNTTAAAMRPTVAIHEPWSRHRTVRVPCFIQGWAGHAIFVAVKVTVVEPLVIPAPSAVLPTITAGDAASSPAVTSGSKVVDTMLALGCTLSGASNQKRHHKAVVTPTEIATSLGNISLSGDGQPLTSGISVDFGSVPSLAKATRTVHLHCVRQDGSDQPLRISVAPYDPYGPFSVTRPPSVLSERGQRCELALTFRPRQKAVYNEQLLVLVGDAHRIVVSCRGEGLPTSLCVTVDQSAVGGAATAAGSKPGAAAGKPGGGAAAAPAAAGAAGKKDAKAGQSVLATSADSLLAPPHVPGTERVAGDGVATVDADLGNCLVGEQTEAVVVFQNNSPFPLDVDITVVADTVQPSNPNGQAPFAITPTHFTLPANGKLDGTVAFRPQCAAAFTATAFVSYGGTESVKRLCLCGFGRSTGVYVRFPPQSNAPVALLTSTPAPAEIPVPASAGAGGGAAGADDTGIPLTRPNTTDAATRPGTTTATAAGGPPRPDAAASVAATGHSQPLYQPRFQPFAIFGDAPPAIGAAPELPIEIYFSAEASAPGAGGGGGGGPDGTSPTPGGGAPPPTKAQQAAAAAAEPAVAEPAVRTITFGTVGGSNAAEVSVEGLTDADARAGWKVDVPKVPVPGSGQRTVLSITFAPTVHVMNMVPLRGVAVACSAAIRLVVKGGTPVADTTYYVRLVGTLKRP